MAYLANQHEDEDDNNQGGQAGQPAGMQGSQQLSTGQSSTIGSQSAGSQTGLGTSSSAGQKGTGYVNVQDYVKKNQNSGFTQDVGNKLDSNVSSARQGLGNVYNTFQTQSAQAAPRRDGATLQTLASPGGNFDIKSAAQKRALENMLNASYAGPRDLSEIQGYTNTLTDYQRAGQNLQNTATAEGRHALLKDMYARPDYSKGMSRLDQAVLQADPNARGILQGLRDKYADHDQRLADTQAQARNLGLERENQATSIRNEAQKAIADRINHITSEAQRAAQQRNKKRRAAAKRDVESFKTTYGNTAKELGIDINKYIESAYGGDIDANATVNDYNRNLYRYLAGIDNTDNTSVDQFSATAPQIAALTKIKRKELKKLIEKLSKPSGGGGDGGDSESWAEKKYNQAPKDNVSRKAEEESKKIITGGLR